MTTVETRVVEPVPSHASVNAVDVSETEIVDAALKHEENKMLEDEEIDSCEGEDLEEQMINVALMNSVVDSVGQPVPSGGTQQSPTRYGLRKRQRPGNSSDGENNGETDMAPPPSEVSSVVPKATITNGRLSFVAPTASAVGDTGGQHSIHPGEATVPHLKLEPLPFGVPAVSQPISLLSSAGTTIGKSRQRPVQPIAPNIPIKAEPAQVLPKPAAPPLMHPGAPRPTAPSPSKARSKPVATKAKKPSSMRQKGGRQVVSKAKVAASSLRSAPLVPTSGAVPNPLLQSQSTPPPPARSMKTAMKSAPKVPNHRGAPSVPCPLPAAVPCPLQPQQLEAPADRRVTIADPPVLTTRNRIFSVDLDPSTFDFPDMSGDGDMEKGEDVIPEIPEDLAPFKRDRAFSFEFFSFAGDDLLPAPPAAPAPAPHLPDPPTTDGVVSSRPRGDSIIFDPVSFQDGGIHEKNAIIKVNAAKKFETNPPLLADSRLAAPSPVQVRPQPSRLIAAAPQPGPPPVSQHPSFPMSPPSTENGQLVTLPSALTMPDANGNNSGTFQMELLNKDGRIGIYLPDARRARIARFHAKRKMRIWRKRIKYDCRKKLADSRPRIKGRFVKRSDMDD